MYFKYGEKETQYLKSKCKKLASAIEQIGHIERIVEKDLFAALIHHIIGQQISAKAQATIWQRIKGDLPTINADTILSAGINKLQSFGMSFKKATYIRDFALEVKNGRIDLEAMWQKSDEEVISELSALKGVGVWTAQMLLLFCMERKNIFSYNDLAIQRGLRILYHHKKITKALFEKYRQRFSPYCSVASLYLWAIASLDTRLESKDIKANITRGGDTMDEKEKLRAIKNRDKSYDGQFFCAVKSTGIVCYPSCSSRRPLEKNIALYDTLEEAIAQGFRPCKICMKALYKDKKPQAIYYQSTCDSPIGEITLACDTKENLVGLWLEGQKYFGDTLKGERITNNELKIFKQTKQWLERYFKGENPKISELPLAPIGNEFRQSVWQMLCEIPYGEVCTYGDIAQKLAKQKGIAKMSAQAVGNAVGHNPISLIIPCHRVIGSNGKLTGYSGGLKRKEWLLEFERKSAKRL